MGKEVSNDRKGWECPKCGVVYSPDVEQCKKCKGKSVNKKQILLG